MSVTVYSYTDGSAPSITRTGGSLITFFDSVLVSGYGTKSSCGWTKVTASSSTTAVYTAPTALGNFHMIVDDNYLSTANHWMATVRFVGGGTVTGINSVTNGYKWPGLSSNGSCFIAPSTDNVWSAIVKTTTNLATATAVRWSVVNNSARGFYLWIDQLNETAASKPSAATFYGIVRPKMFYGVTDTAVLTMFRATGTGSPTWIPWDLTMPSNFGAIDSRYHQKHLYNYKNNKFVTLIDYSPAPRTVTGSDVLGNAVTNYAGYPSLDGNMMVTDINLFVEESYGGGRPICRLPGILAPLHSLPLNHLDTIAGSAPYASSNYLAWCAQSGQVLIDTTDNWG